MLEKPDLSDEKIIACLQEQFGLQAVQVVFLALGADVNTAVYRVVAEDQTPYFLKLRSGSFDETSVTLPRFLYEQGIRQIIPPLATRSAALSAHLDDFHVILYPFVPGHNGYEVSLTERHWVDLGAAFKRLHTAAVPSALTSRLQHESYSPQWRERVKAFQAQVEAHAFDDPVAASLAALLGVQRAVIRDLVERAERLGAALQSRDLPQVVCHADIHAGNVLIDANGDLYVVDWDTLILAPKERDLMYVGGGQFANSRPAQEEELLFYRGYGQTQVDATALAYYRYERIVQDIAAYCEQILLSDEGGDDREVGLRQLASQFQPDGVIRFAYQSDQTALPEMIRARCEANAEEDK